MTAAPIPKPTHKKRPLGRNCTMNIAQMNIAQWIRTLILTAGLAGFTAPAQAGPDAHL